MSRKFPLKAPFLGTALLLLLLALPRWFGIGSAGGQLAVSFLDVGQGDAILVRAPDGQNILVDGGPDRTVVKRLAEHLPWWDRTIDLAVLTHPHDDHVGGLPAVLERYRVRRVLQTGVVHASPVYLAWLDGLRAAGTETVVASAGQAIGLGPDTRLEVLWPDEKLAGLEVPSLNDSSVVLRLVHGQTAFLLTGDIERPAEEALLAQGSEVSAQVIKAPHHGSKTSLMPDFLRAVAPEQAVISVGAGNRYNHPDPKTLDLLASQGIAIYRTDRDGTVSFKSDGKKISLPK